MNEERSSNRMRILISALSRFTQPTGICRHAANLARCLADVPEIAHVTLLVGKWQEDYFRSAFDISSPKIEIVPIAIANHSLARNFWFAWGLPTLARKYDPSIVHLGFPVPVFRSRFDCPVVATMHDLYPYDLPESLGRFNGFCKRLFVKRCMRASDGVTCVSESTRKALGRRFPALASRVPVHLVHNYAEFSPGSYVSPLGDDRRPFFLAVAQHQPNKRLELVLQAIAELRSEAFLQGDFQLCIVGTNGAHSERLRGLARQLGVEACVNWLPPLSDRELAWMYTHCSAFIASSSIEGFCLPLLEAQVFRCRIIASDIPVFHEIAGDTPIYFSLQGRPVENLKTAILHIMRAPFREQNPNVRFSRRTTTLECLELYAKLLPAFVVRDSVDEVSLSPAQRRLHAAAE